MLTRLRVNNFKNLVDFDVSFGPFTCIAGENGVGKSNLFDAIRFLSALADRSLVEAAATVRSDGSERGRDLRSLFHRVGDTYAETMTFDAEMIIPKSGVDDLGQPAIAQGTFVRYRVELAWNDVDFDKPPLMIVSESLDYVTHSKEPIRNEHLLFDHSDKWLGSVIEQNKRGNKSPFISTEGKHIFRHQEGRSGQPFRLLASTLPRTVLSSVNATESSTAVLVKREMQSWRFLQLEPTAMRSPDDFRAPFRIDSDGAHLPATLERLARHDEAGAFRKIANALMELVDDIRDVRVDRDEKYELLTIMIRGKDQTWHPAKALSDGTLRFLALAILNLDSDANGVICLEEPENGIHPKRIPAIIQLLNDIAVDTDYAVGKDNPLRQVIVNTHSPAIVSEISDEDLLVARLHNAATPQGEAYKKLRLHPLQGTWRTRPPLNGKTAAISSLFAYLSPVQRSRSANGHKQRVIDREDVQMALFPPEGLDS